MWSFRSENIRMARQIVNIHKSMPLLRNLINSNYRLAVGRRGAMCSSASSPKKTNARGRNKWKERRQDFDSFAWRIIM